MKKYWKGVLFFIPILTVCPSALRAEMDQYSQVLQVSLGGTTAANRYYDHLANAGIDLGAAYRIYPFQNIAWSLGLEANRTTYKDQPTANLYERKDITLLYAGPFARYDFTPSADGLLYFSAGALAIEFSKDINTPTGTDNTTTTRGGYFFGFGYDCPVGEDYRIGAEFRTIGDSDYFVEAVTGRLTFAYVWSPG
jgi:hypothetical protein